MLSSFCGRWQDVKSAHAAGRLWCGDQKGEGAKEAGAIEAGSAGGVKTPHATHDGEHATGFGCWLVMLPQSSAGLSCGLW